MNIQRQPQHKTDLNKPKEFVDITAAGYFGDQINFEAYFNNLVKEKSYNKLISK